MFSRILYTELRAVIKSVFQSSSPQARLAGSSGAPITPSFGRRIENPDSSPARHVDVSFHVHFQPVRRQRFAHYIGEKAAVGDTAVFVHIENTQVIPLGVRDVEQRFVGRKASPLGTASSINSLSSWPSGPSR